jgi:hypothetical protein
MGRDPLLSRKTAPTRHGLKTQIRNRLTLLAGIAQVLRRSFRHAEIGGNEF